MNALSDAVGVVGRILWGVSLVYMIALVAAGISESRRHRRMPAGGEPDGPPLYFYFLIAALNEAEVIGTTVRSLAKEAPNARIVVVDDASDDDTGRLALAAAPFQVLSVTRRLPGARLGKGPALNAGLVAIRKNVRRRYLDPDRVVVVVMDADGHLSPGATGVVGSLFAADPEVGAVQLAVRIRNRNHILTKIQDHDFWGICALTQIGRSRFRTVSLGGNGQFSRLSALDSIGEEPWSAALTEDLDLGISMAVAGWAAVSTPKAFVDQQGLTNLRALLRQRTRWFQGHMMAGRRIPEIWRSPTLSTAGCFEMCLYVISPWFFVVLWSLVIQLLYVQLALELANSGSSFYGSSVTSKVVFGLGLYLISFAPIMVIGFVYHRRAAGVGIVRAVLYSHLSIGFQYLQYVAAWRALGRMVMGRKGWVKTSRQIEVVDVDETDPVLVAIG